MKPNSNLAKMITAAHRGSQLSQQAYDVVHDTMACLAKACDEHFIIRPSDYQRGLVAEAIATALLDASPWLRGVVDTQGVDMRH